MVGDNEHSDPCVLKAAFQATHNPVACTAGYIVEEAHREPDGSIVSTKARLYGVAIVPAASAPCEQRARIIPED